jgi:hypothetical protein
MNAGDQFISSDALQEINFKVRPKESILVGDVEIENLLKISDTIIFSTVLHPDPVPMPKDWWYYGLDHGQHISFYSKKTFGFIAKEFKLNYYNVDSLHILTKKSIPIWKLMATRLSKFGLYKVLAKRLDSKTWADHHLMTKEVK